MSAETSTTKTSKRSSATKFFLRGLAIVLPAILTVAILVWMGGIVNTYIISPTSWLVRWTIAMGIESEYTRSTDELVRWEKLPPLEYCEQYYRITRELKQELEERLQQTKENNKLPPSLAPEIPPVWLGSIIDNDASPQVYVPLARKKAVPYRHFRLVAEEFAPAQGPTTATELYMEFVTLEYFGSQFLLSAGAVSIAIVLLYFLGRLVTVRLGAWLVHRFETVVLSRLPLISHVYSSVKQITDFLFSERQIEYNRVVAVEYPRRGIWSIGFVTGDSMLEITAVAGEPLVSVLIPTSPMPVTGYTMNIPRSDVIDLNVTIDQAFQFCVSCGVLVPPQQTVTPELLQQELARRLNGAGDSATAPPNDKQPQPDPAVEQAETPT